MMVYRLACELSDEIAAIAPVAATMVTDSCNPKRPVPVMHFHGTADSVLPYLGGTSVNPLLGKTEFRGVEDVISFWVERNNCIETPNIILERGDVTCSSFSHCEQNADVVMCKIEGGGHTWPGGSPVKLFGKTNQDISASEVMWKFFQEHPMP